MNELRQQGKTDRADQRPLRRGWTTGACATAAAKAAASALFGAGFPDPVTIRLPRGGSASFALAETARFGDGRAMAAVVKDAGDDPDVTHGCLVCATLARRPAGSGVSFRAGPGVGTVTLPGLPLPVGEPAINPVPRRMMVEAVSEVAHTAGCHADLEIEIAIPDGEAIAKKTWNPRLGILGGLSILGTTGIVVPYSCSAWIHSVQRGVDVARAAGLAHLAAVTGSTSEAAVRRRYGLPDIAILDMGDFVGGTLKYLRRHAVPRLTLAGGFAKTTKLAAGAMDLHSRRSQVDFALLAELARGLGAKEGLGAAIAASHTAMRALDLAARAGLPLADAVAHRARQVAQEVVGGRVAVEVLAVDRKGRIVGYAPGW